MLFVSANLHGFSNLSVTLRAVWGKLTKLRVNCPSLPWVQQIELLHNVPRWLYWGLLQTALTQDAHKAFLVVLVSVSALWRTTPSCSHLLPSCVFCGLFQRVFTFHPSEHRRWLKLAAQTMDASHSPATVATYQLRCSLAEQSTSNPPPSAWYAGSDLLKGRTRKHSQKLNCFRWLMMKLIYSGSALMVSNVIWENAESIAQLRIS